MIPFLDCNIWVIRDTPDATRGDNFYFIYLIHQYNSLTGSFNTEFFEDFYKIPQFEINNIHLMDSIDWKLLQNGIPVLKKNEDDTWEINLKYYDEYINLQSNSN